MGAETIIDYVEIFSNNDDGIEFFGGKPNVKHALVAFCADDGFDYDEGFRGKGQFWVVIQDIEGEVGDRGGEHDGGTDPEDGQPYATPTISNATYIGRGTDAGKRLLTFRDNAGGYYYNSIFANWGKGVDIEKLGSGEDSFNRYTSGELFLKNNLFWDVVSAGASAGAEDLFKVSFGSGASDNGESSEFVSSFEENGNLSGDPGLQYAQVTPGGNALQLVPSASAVDGTEMPGDSWFDNVNYKGAFAPGQEAWIKGWTYLDQLGFLDDVATGITEQKPSNTRIYPNPATDKLYIETDPENPVIEVNIFNISGKLVRAENFTNGDGTITLKTGDLHQGMYIIRLKTPDAEQIFKILIQ